MRTAGREAERCAWHPSLLPLLPEDFSFSLQGRHLATQFTPLLIFLRTQALASWAALGRRWGGWGSATMETRAGGGTGEQGG